ncbi:MAG: hypothetical protein ABIT76_09655 [Chthoniobacterales bacterium]
MSIAAQSLEEIPPPAPPLVAPVPQKADWTVTVQLPPLLPPKDGTTTRQDKRITKVHSNRTGKLRRDRVSAADGTTVENWYADTLLLWPSNDGEVAASDLSGIPLDTEDPSPSVPRGFPGTGWIKLEYYDKVVLVEKRPYYHYVHGNTEAWIDVETKLPLAYKFSNTPYRYTFNEPPVEPLILPLPYQKTLDICEKDSAYRKQVENDLRKRH